ncbi:PepSY domain-containing protein [Carboxylicivirga sp. A043]|uniref:PepSY-associated TM helix domain-containing protein n=1 Tax=Carboxylicivirga litoralis TaxID=2816963 RepID=UPI0021CB0EDA|nr:PepSY-associated TM helix domain-containing protein [Carboxylicivirga sp. A043]MCU4155644.1 PepSY domain-containing protein [Carboxylicivirga sp. A043]
MPSIFKRINHWLHLWLGLLSGLVVFIVALTGAVYVFHQEIKDTLEPWRFVEAQDSAFVPPSCLIDTARKYVPHLEPTGLTYEDKEGAAAVGFISQQVGKIAFEVVFMNPYTGTFIKRQNVLGEGQFDFFHFIEDGHRHLWLPEKIGGKVVGIGVLLFLLISLSGLILWWPRKWNKQHLKRSLSIKRTSNSKRLLLDLHNVLGFYILLFGCVLAITGLVWSFDWFGNAFYYLSSGGETKPLHEHPHSDISQASRTNRDSIAAIDQAFFLTMSQEHNPQRIFINPSIHEEDEPIEIVVSLIKGKYYKHNEYFYDRYTLAPLRMKGDRFEEASFADKLDKMNYDIHTGAILGLPGKILAFIVSLIIASLPITGFLLWWNKQRVL